MSKTLRGKTVQGAALVKAALDRLQKTLEKGRIADASKASARMARVERQIKKFEGTLSEMTAQANKFSLPGAMEDKHRGETFSIARAVCAITASAKGDTRAWDSAPLEAKVFEEMSRKGANEAFAERRQKAGEAGTDYLGGFIVPTEYLDSQFIELLRAESISRQLGATVMTGLAGSPVLVPKQTSTATAYWVAENGSITESDVEYGQIRMEPRMLAAFNKMSLRFLALGNAADQKVNKDFAQQIALGQDLAVLKGTGNNEPTGIRNATGVLTNTTAAPVTFNNLSGFIDELMQNNSLKGRLGWAIHPTRYNEIDTMLEAANQSLERKLITQGTLTNIRGYPYAVSTQLAATDVIFGNWEDVYIGEWGGMALESSTQSGSAFQSVQVHVRAILDTDVAVARAESFAIDVV